MVIAVYLPLALSRFVLVRRAAAIRGSDDEREEIEG